VKIDIEELVVVALRVEHGRVDSQAIIEPGRFVADLVVLQRLGVERPPADAVEAAGAKARRIARIAEVIVAEFVAQHDSRLYVAERLRAPRALRVAGVGLLASVLVVTQRYAECGAVGQVVVDLSEYGVRSEERR